MPSMPVATIRLPRPLSSRPDSAERMRRAHEAAEFDSWFRGQVQAALDDPRPAVPHAEVKAAWEVKRAALLARAKGGAE
jgi:hypothetical protein